MKRDVHALYWLDAQTEHGWGEGHAEPPCAVSVGFVLEWPDPSQPRPCYRIAGGCVEEEPGGTTVIPADMVVRSRYVATIEVPIR